MALGPSARYHTLIAHPDQVVRRHRQDKLEVQLLAAEKPALAQATNGLDSAEAFLKEFLQLQIHHCPAALGDILLRPLDRLMGVPARPKAVARSREGRFEDR